MKFIFIFHEVYKHVTNSVKPLPINSLDAQNNAHKDAKTNHIETLCLIHQCVDAKVLKKILKLIDFKNAWDMLLKIYEGYIKVKKVKLYALR